MSRRGIPPVGAGREPPARPRARARGGEGGSCHTTATLRSSGMVRRDVEQVRRRHSNNYVPAQARSAKLSQRAWVQSHLRLTSMSVRKRKEKTECIPRSPSAFPLLLGACCIFPGQEAN